MTEIGLLLLIILVVGMLWVLVFGRRQRANELMELRAQVAVLRDSEKALTGQHDFTISTRQILDALIEDMHHFSMRAQLQEDMAATLVARLSACEGALKESQEKQKKPQLIE